MKLICKGLAFVAKVAALTLACAAAMMMLSVLTVLLPITVCAAGAAAVYGVGERLEEAARRKAGLPMHAATHTQSRLREVRK